jgi:hypothetical protein
MMVRQLRQEVAQLLPYRRSAGQRIARRAGAGLQRGLQHDSEVKVSKIALNHGAGRCAGSVLNSQED